MSKYFNNLVGRMNKSFGERVAKKISWNNVSGYETRLCSDYRPDDSHITINGKFRISITNLDSTVNIPLPDRYSNSKIKWNKLETKPAKTAVGNPTVDHVFEFSVTLPCED